MPGFRSATTDSYDSGIGFGPQEIKTGWHAENPKALTPTQGSAHHLHSRSCHVCPLTCLSPPAPTISPSANLLFLSPPSKLPVNLQTQPQCHLLQEATPSSPGWIGVLSPVDPDRTGGVGEAGGHPSTTDSLCHYLVTCWLANPHWPWPLE